MSETENNRITNRQQLAEMLKEAVRNTIAGPPQTAKRKQKRKKPNHTQQQGSQSETET
jgi:hypothetical protein